MKAGVYKIYFENDCKNKVYIGISNNLTRRKYDHKTSLSENCHKNPHLQNAFKKYGIENFRFEILELCEVENLIKKEKEYIDKFNSFNNKFGYNLTSGGEHFNLSQSTKDKLSKVKSGRKLSDKTKIKLAVHNLLKNRPELNVEVIDGKIFVDGKQYVKSKKGKFKTPKDEIEIKKRREISEIKRIQNVIKSCTNRKKSAEEIEKIREANLGKKASLETRKKIGSYHVGKQISKQHRESIKDKLGHKITLVFNDGNTMYFKSQRECAKYFNIKSNSIPKKVLSSNLIKEFIIN